MKKTILIPFVLLCITSIAQAEFKFNPNISRGFDYYEVGLSPSSGTVLESLIDAKLAKSSGVVVESLINSKLEKSSGTVIEGIIKALPPTNIAAGTLDADVIVSSAGINIIGSNNVIDGTLQQEDIGEYTFAAYIGTPAASIPLSALLCAPSRGFAVTLTTVTAEIIGGTNVIFMIEQRAIGAIGSAGTDIFSGDVTVAVGKIAGGTPDDFTIPANTELYFVPTSVSGDVQGITIRTRYTKD